MTLVRTLVIALAALAAGSPAARLAPSLTSAESNVAYAVAAVCAPYVLEGADPAGLPPRQPLVQDDGWRSRVFEGLGAPKRVGYAGFVHVAVGAPRGGRDCELTAGEGDPQKLRQAILAVLQARPEGFAPSRSRYLPGSHFATEDNLCTRGDSRAPTAFVLLSAAPEHAHPAVLLTVAASPSRMESCDRPGVRMNYRALAPDQG